MIDGEAFVKDPYPILKRVERFLGLRSYIKREQVVWDDEKKFFVESLTMKSCVWET